VSCIVYLDDILIYSRTEEEHVIHVQQVLGRLRRFKLYAKMSKCEFYKDRVGFLGYVVTPEGVTMEQDRIKTISEWPTPGSIHDVRVFIGFANYYHRFIRGFSKLAAPLNRLTEKGPNMAKGGHKQRTEESRPVRLGPEELGAFEKLKSRFLEAPVLTHFRPDQPIRLETDASGFAVSGIISQPCIEKDQKVQYRPIAFYSRKLIAAEKNYDTHDAELLAIVASFKHWRHYLEGAMHQVEVLSDHANLQYFMTTKVLSRRQVRWAEWLATFNFRLMYRQGKVNPADGPSRRPDYNADGPDMDHNGPQGLSSALTGLQQQLAHGASPVAECPKVMGALSKAGGLSGPTRRGMDSLVPYLAGAAQQAGEGSDLQSQVRASLQSDERSHQVKEGLQQPAMSRKAWLRAWKEQNGLLWHNERLYIPAGSARLQVLAQGHDDPLSGNFGFQRTLELIQR